MSLLHLSTCLSCTPPSQHQNPNFTWGNVIKYETNQYILKDITLFAFKQWKKTTFFFHQNETKTTEKVWAQSWESFYHGSLFSSQHDGNYGPTLPPCFPLSPPPSLPPLCLFLPSSISLFPSSFLLSLSSPPPLPMSPQCPSLPLSLVRYFPKGAFNT